VVDSVEEMFSEDAKRVSAVETAGKKGVVKLIFPLCTGEVGRDEQWPWDVCGGLIGGPRGNRFCTKPIKDVTYPHCGVGSHVAHKAALQEGHGYIPSIHDRANTESAFLEPNVASDRFPNSIKDLIGQALSHEEWIACLTYLPDEEGSGPSREFEQDLATQALEKSRMMVSFAITPAAQKAKLPNMVAKVLNSKSAKNLENQFNEEDNTTGKVELSFDDLEAPISEEWEESGAASSAFSPSVAQWNSLIHQVEILTTELGTAREALALVADISESCFKSMDGQITNLHGSVGSRPMWETMSLLLTYGLILSCWQMRFQKLVKRESILSHRLMR
jgi:hypothetical protein